MIPITFFFLFFLCAATNSQYLSKNGNTDSDLYREEVDDAAISMHTFRLKPGEDLKRGIANYVDKHNLRAVSIVTAVGSLRQVNIRLATQRNGSISYFFRDRDMFEIVSLVGTFESYEDKTPYGHVHISIADVSGNMVGGHLMKGCVIFTTAEITLIENRRIQFRRDWDKSTGYNELSIEERSIAKSVVPQDSRTIETHRKQTHWKENILSAVHNIVATFDISDDKNDFDNTWD